MQIDRVTFTGADDSIDPAVLASISQQYPYVEWGILFSPKHQGSPRYPSDGWLDGLLDVAQGTRALFKLSAHLCGGWVRELMSGQCTEQRFRFRAEYSDLWPFFQRVQLNFHAERQRIAPGLVSTLVDAQRSFIMQCDGENDVMVREFARQTRMVSPLFDTSGGAGIVPHHWPKPWPGVYCGYAGGMGPENVHGVIKDIEAVAGNATIWIDMERRVRSEDDRLFDITKVLSVLEQVEHYRTQVSA